LVKFTRWYLRDDVEQGIGTEAHDNLVPLIIGLWSVLGILVVVAFFSFPDTITALLNPEFWALEKVLSHVGT
jgi:hypothetical protein